MANERGTTSIWLAKEKYKSFALACKRFNFQISEILEAFMDEFMVRYPLEDPNEIKYIQAPIFTPRKKVHPDIREEIQKGLLKWLSIFVCPECGFIKHIHTDMLKKLEERGIQPACRKCHASMELEEATPKCQ